MATDEVYSSSRRKLALIIGNDNYSNSNNQLKNSIKNATDFSNSLENINFEVTTAFDLKDKQEIISCITDFSETVDNGDFILFYFSGHIYQVKGENYFIPVDESMIKTERDIEDLAVNVGNQIKRLAAVNSFYATIFILDCCNTYELANPSTSNTANQDKSLCEIQPPPGTFIQFSCGANRVPSNSKNVDRNSIFVKHLLTNITRENVDIIDIFRNITEAVYKESKDTQKLMCMNGLQHHGRIYFNEVIYPTQVDFLDAPHLLSNYIDNTIHTTPQVLSMESSPTQTKVSVIPVWFDEINITEPIRYPSTITATTDEDIRQTFDIVAKYRMAQFGHQDEEIDFNAEPFIPSVDSTETLVVGLHNIAQTMGMKTSFTRNPFNYQDSNYCIACGVATLATLPFHATYSIETPLTAVFTLNLDWPYEAVTSSENQVKNFVLAFIDDIAKIINEREDNEKEVGCHKEYIRVFELMRGSTVVKFGITTPHMDDTQELAKRFRRQARRKFPAHLPVLKNAKPDEYNPEWKFAVEHLQLQESDFEPEHNRDYRNWPASCSEQERGSQPYYLPVGWYRHALLVVDKYGNEDARWLGMINGPGEWSVAYHGTKDEAANSIVRDGVHPAFENDGFKEEAIKKAGPKANVIGTYLGTHCNRGADHERYAKPFVVKMPPGSAMAEEMYSVVFQCRVKPNSYTVHKEKRRKHEPVKYKELRVFEKDAIRPYGILLRKVT